MSFHISTEELTRRQRRWPIGCSPTTTSVPPLTTSTSTPSPASTSETLWKRGTWRRQSWPTSLGSWWAWPAFSQRFTKEGRSPRRRGIGVCRLAGGGSSWSSRRGGQSGFDIKFAFHAIFVLLLSASSDDPVFILVYIRPKKQLPCTHKVQLPLTQIWNMWTSFKNIFTSKLPPSRLPFRVFCICILSFHVFALSWMVNFSPTPLPSIVLSPAGQSGCFYRIPCKGS